MSGYDIEKVKDAMKTGSFELSRCETQKEMEEEGVDFSLPYVISNPYYIDIEE